MHFSLKRVYVFILLLHVFKDTVNMWYNTERDCELSRGINLVLTHFIN